MTNDKTQAAKELLHEINDQSGPPITVEEINAVSRAQQKAELEKADLNECMAKINAALKDHNCDLFCTPQITADGRLVASAGVQNRKG